MENSLEKWKSHSSCGNCPQGQLQITSCASADQSLEPAAMHYRHEVKARSSQQRKQPGCWRNTQTGGTRGCPRHLQTAKGLFLFLRAQFDI